MTFNFFVSTSLLSWNWFFFFKRKMKGHISNSGLWPYSPDVSTQLPLYLLPWDSVLRKIGWLWLALYPFLFHCFQGQMTPTCLSWGHQADYLKLLRTPTPASWMNALTAPEALAMWGLPVQTVCLWVCLLGTWNILLTLLRVWPSNTPAAESSPYTSSLK